MHILPMDLQGFQDAKPTPSLQLPASQLHDSLKYYGERFVDMKFHPQLFGPFLTKRRIMPQSTYEAHISEVKFKGVTWTDSSIQQAAVADTPIVIDIGATFGTTPFESDLIPGTVEKVNGTVKNLSGNSSITARGFGPWHVQDKNGVNTVIEPFL